MVAIWAASINIWLPDVCLEPSTVYQLRLLAFNARGESQASVQTVQTASVASDGLWYSL